VLGGAGEVCISVEQQGEVERRRMGCVAALHQAVEGFRPVAGESDEARVVGQRREIAGIEHIDAGIRPQREQRHEAFHGGGIGGGQGRDQADRHGGGPRGFGRRFLGEKAQGADAVGPPAVVEPEDIGQAVAHRDFQVAQDFRRARLVGDRPDGELPAAGGKRGDRKCDHRRPGAPCQQAGQGSAGREAAEKGTEFAMAAGPLVGHHADHAAAAEDGRGSVEAVVLAEQHRALLATPADGQAVEQWVLQRAVDRPAAHQGP